MTQDIAASKMAIIAEARNTFLVLAGASLLPIVFHLIPAYSGVPQGTRFLPIFYAPFIGIIIFRPRVGIIAGILAPAVNALITRRPEAGILVMLTVELVIFTAISSVLWSRWKNFWGAAPAAYIIAKFISGAALGITPYFAAGKEGIGLFASSVVISLPGIIALTLINLAAVRYKERTQE